ncbi:hypothetical protein AWM70_12620 [Paenibacillus yonginensis]|uniref:Uncharacterized protein n=1 Tax=Paenibacillus yonginensis TaxID=1462996 RepID=A0A1B1N1M8_9BACL|nr:hypothetical protein [Paenibacillus yonginensis]ANS75347.1 hypothetical protein AWM70_12620 [Paenibacillus yonginensis]
MNDTVEKSIIWVVEVFLFITACMFAISGINSQEAAVKVVKHSSEQDERRLYTDLKETGEETYTGAEVIESIYHIKQLDANIEIGRYYFFKSDDLDNIDVSGIDPQQNYKVNYIRDESGKLLTIVFS